MLWQNLVLEIDVLERRLNRAVESAFGEFF